MGNPIKGKEKNNLTSSKKKKSTSFSLENKIKSFSRVNIMDGVNVTKMSRISDLV